MKLWYINTFHFFFPKMKRYREESGGGSEEGVMMCVSVVLVHCSQSQAGWLVAQPVVCHGVTEKVVTRTDARRRHHHSPGAHLVFVILDSY